MKKRNFLEFIQKELMDYQRKVVVPFSKARVKPFDVETILEEVTRARKTKVKKFRGPDSLLYSAIYPIVFAMKVFGLAPYDFMGDQLTSSNCCLLFTFAFMTIYSHIIYIVYLRFLSLQRNNTILSVVETTKVISVLFPGISGFQTISIYVYYGTTGNSQLSRRYVRSRFNDIHEESVQPNLECPTGFRRETQPTRLPAQRSENRDNDVDFSDQSDYYLDGR